MQSEGTGDKSDNPPPVLNIQFFNYKTMSRKQKIKLEVGKRYKGYGVLNEYGEYTFEPCSVMDEPQERTVIINAILTTICMLSLCGAVNSQLRV